jgi:hypothetical protein
LAGASIASFITGSSNAKKFAVAIPDCGTRVQKLRCAIIKAREPFRADGRLSDVDNRQPTAADRAQRTSQRRSRGASATHRADAGGRAARHAGERLTLIQRGRSGRAIVKIRLCLTLSFFKKCDGGRRNGEKNSKITHYLIINLDSVMRSDI